MIVLGITRDVHDPAAAIVVDGNVVAAAEEERFTRVKHAPGTPPFRSAAYCLEAAGVRGADVDAVAYPWSLETYRRNRWTYARRIGPSLPRHALRALLRTGSRWSREMAMVGGLLAELGVDRGRTRFVSVSHHLAHAASAYRPSGRDRALVLTADAMGEFDSAGAWVAEGERMTKIWELLLPRSLGTFYTAVTEFLGFEPNDGEYKTMGLAPLGSPGEVDLSPLCRLEGGEPLVDPRRVFPPRRYRNGTRFHSADLETFLGEPGMGEKVRPPYNHIAAAAQALVEEAVLGWLAGPLREGLSRAGGVLCLAGGLALNVKMNGRLLQEGGVESLWVQPASHDAGGSLGAAVQVAAAGGDRVEPMKHVFLGPVQEAETIEALLRARRIPFRRPPALVGEAAALLARGEVVGRFDGPMEWGPRALGNRSILAHPGRPGTADRINKAVKFRETWRPFCPAILEERAGEVFGAPFPSPFMTVNFHVRPPWRARLLEVVHVDGTARIQTVGRSPAEGGFRALLEAFEEKTGCPVLLNTSLNRRGEPIACTAEDALDVFFGTGLEHLVLGPFLLSKGRGGKGKP
ncbi:MAG: carbamoyltransferase family protein [Planctomycetota bacterium]|jgi:carbamoyltransferase